ncbi:hypothetical protein ILYODFUR_030636 [Ilyodon furcidens]|uniref:Uncharacterized protein n=1 Tax=Ilyodon furcidens TaxID=33524 RepID=A0ABV0T326_9TELE
MKKKKILTTACKSSVIGCCIRTNQISKVRSIWRCIANASVRCWENISDAGLGRSKWSKGQCQPTASASRLLTAEIDSGYKDITRYSL